MESGSSERKKRPTQARKSNSPTRERVLFDAANRGAPHWDRPRTWDAVLPKLLAHLTAQNYKTRNLRPSHNINIQLRNEADTGSPWSLGIKCG
jgi:hypothetical protein